MSQANQPQNNLLVLNLQNVSDDIEEEEEHDMIVFHLSSEIIKINFYQFCKYSHLIQKEFHNTTSIQEIIENIENKIHQYHIKDESVKKLFKIFNDEQIEIAIDEYNDFCKLAEIFKVKSIKKLLKRTAQKFSENVQFLLNLLINRIEDLKSSESIELFENDYISYDIEEKLSKHVNDCLKSDNFSQLPISMVYRIIEKSDCKKKISLLSMLTIHDFYPTYDLNEISEKSDKFIDLFTKFDIQDEIKKINLGTNLIHII